MLTGEPAVLYVDTLYCVACADILAPGLAEEQWFALDRGAVCGGGSPLD